MALERFHVQVDDEWLDVSVELREGCYVVTCGDRTWQADLQQISGTNLVTLLLGEESIVLLVDRDHHSYTVLRDTEHYNVRVRPAWAGNGDLASLQATASGEQTVESPLVGVVLEVAVQQGQSVQRGDILAVVEAMKMQNEVRAPRDATVKAVRVRPGQKVNPKQPLVVLE